MLTQCWHWSCDTATQVCHWKVIIPVNNNELLRFFKSFNKSLTFLFTKIQSKSEFSPLNTFATKRGNRNHFATRSLSSKDLKSISLLKQPFTPSPACWCCALWPICGRPNKGVSRSHLRANLSITTLLLLPDKKKHQKLRPVTHKSLYLCVSLVIAMCGPYNPALCCLFLLQLNYKTQSWSTGYKTFKKPVAWLSEGSMIHSLSLE